MSTHPEVLWAQRSSETDAEKVCPNFHHLITCITDNYHLAIARQNIVFLTVNLTDIDESTLKYELKPREISFQAEGKL